MDLAISSLGMATSLGGIVRGSAAQRAGLTRPVSLDSFFVPEGDRYAPIVAHRALPEGSLSFGMNLWSRMALEAARDLLQYGALPDSSDEHFWRRTAVMAAVPVMGIERFGGTTEELGEKLLRELVGGLLTSLDLAGSVVQRFVFPDGQSAVARALAVARARIERHHFDRALIIAVDSWVDMQSLFWLGARDRLKTSETPAGLSPSEAAACVLVERTDACSRRGGRIEGLVLSEIVGGEARAERASATATGRHLAAATRQALGVTGPPGAFVGDIYVDLNGEAHRAMAWGCALPQLVPCVDFERSRVVLPCAELGDTGAAGPAIAICLGTRSFVRRYALGQRALVCSVAEHGDASAIVIAAPGRVVENHKERRGANA